MDPNPNPSLDGIGLGWHTQPSVHGRVMPEELCRNLTSGKPNDIIKWQSSGSD